MRYLLIFIITLFFFSCKKNSDLDLKDDSLIAYFPLDSSFTDESGKDYKLEAFGSPEFVSGHKEMPSTAILLDGEDDYLVTTINEIDSFSIAMWLVSYRYFVGEWPHRRSTVFDFSDKQVYGSVDGLTGATQLKCGIETEEIAEIDIDDMSKWFHFYMAVGNDVKIYINGSLIQTTPLEDTITYLNNILYFGRASSDNEIELTYFYGKIDEVKVFDKILSQTELDKLILD